MRTLSPFLSSLRMRWFAKCFSLSIIFLATINFAKAQTIIITSSSSSTVFTNTIPLTLNISESPKTVFLIFTNITPGSSDSGKVWTLIMKNSTLSYSLTIKPLDLGNTTNVFYALPNNVPMPDGKYSATAQYTRTSTGTTVSAITPKVFYLDEFTITPKIISPTSNSYLKNNFVFQSDSKEKILAGSKKLLFVKGSDTTTVLLKNQTDTIAFNINDLAGSSSFDITSATPNTLAEGTYMLILRDQDSAGHVIASDTSLNITLDTSISAPSIITPSDGASLKSSFDVTFNLPEKAAANSVKLVFQKGSENDTLIVSNTTAGNNTVTVYPDHLISSQNEVSTNASSLHDGSYIFKLFFTDMVGLTDSAQSSFVLQTDSITVLPTLTTPAANATELTASHLTFTLPENATANSVQVEFMGCGDNVITLDAANAGTYNYTVNGANISSSTGVVSESSNTLTSGTYTVMLSYKDANGNARSYALARNYNFTNGVLGLNFDMLKGYLQMAKTHLQWETASENDLAYFEVEYSKDAKSFSNIGKVKAAGTSYVKQDYSFIHNDPSLTKNYYRLRMVDHDGSFTYSPVVVVYGNNVTEEFKVYPNPATEKLNVTIITSNTGDTHTLKVWDMEGKLMKTIPVQTGSGSNLFTFPINDLNAGNYVLQDGDNVTLFSKKQL